MKKLAVILSILMSSTVIAQGGYVATAVDVVRVSNTGNNGKNFTIKVSGGDGNHPCEEGTITFPLGHAGSQGNDSNIHNRAFSLAITALTTGKKVSVFNYQDDSSCEGSYISLNK